MSRPSGYAWLCNSDPMFYMGMSSAIDTEIGMSSAGVLFVKFVCPIGFVHPYTHPTAELSDLYGLDRFVCPYKDRYF